MKTKTIFILGLLLSLNLILAQTTVISNLGLPQGMIVIEDDLYFGDSDPHGIYKANLSTTPVVASLLFPVTYECNDFAVQNNVLFIGDLAGDNIYKSDLTVDPLVATVFAGPVESSVGLAIKDDFLYFSTFFDNHIMKINITTPSPVAEPVITGTTDGITGIVLDGNDLYYCEWSWINGQSKVTKIDISNSSPIPVTIATGFTKPAGITINGSDIYVAERAANRITRIDLANGNAVSNFLSLNLPHGIEVVGSNLFISQPFDGKIVKTPLSPLSIEDFELKNKIIIVPNPAFDVITITGLTEIGNYKIYNVLGNEIAKGVIANNENIDIKSYSSGLYFVKFEKGNAVKFLKN